MSTLSRIFFIFIVVAAFILCAVVIVIYAAGYKINVQNKNITQTALINIAVDPSDSQVYLNGKLIGKGSQTIRSIDAGDYTLEVKKSGYFTFKKNIEAKEGQAVIVGSVDLFLEKPIIGEADKKISTENLSLLSDSDNLTSTNGELRVSGELVTRLSSEITGPSWFDNKQYIAFTNAGKLKIIAVDGTNLIEIADKDSASPVIFTKSGRFVIYENQGKIVQAKIR